MANSWPPEEYDDILKRIKHYDALYRGEDATEADLTPTHYVNGVPHVGGVLGLVTKLKNGEPIGESVRTSMHVPVATDLAQLSASLLFGETPAIQLPRREVELEGETPLADDEPRPTEAHASQERLDEIMSSDEAHAEYLRGGEYAAAHGGSFLVIVWDEAIADHVFVRAYRADAALPKWRHGHLVEVTFFTEYGDGAKVWRHLERHVPGSITHSLYEGTSDKLGTIRDITARPETAHLAGLKKPNDGALPEAEPEAVIVPTDIPYLTVEYIPNMLPNPEFDAGGGLLANYGRSDYFGLEPLFEKVDFVWGSLARDFDNGLGRVAVPESWLTMGAKRGEGATFDPRTQYYTALSTGVGQNAQEQAIISQFAIRLDEHLGAIHELKKQIAESAGYSPSHFGIHERSTRTATEVNDDRADSESTRDTKGVYVRPRLARLARAALHIDYKLWPEKHAAPPTDELPSIKFADVAQVDPEKRARTVSLVAGVAMSTLSAVREVQPHLDDTEARRERDEILREKGGANAVDPATYRGIVDDGGDPE